MSKKVAIDFYVFGTLVKDRIFCNFHSWQIIAEKSRGGSKNLQIMRLLSLPTSQTIIWIYYTKDLWKDLYDQFAQEDMVRVSDLQEEIYSLR